MRIEIKVKGSLGGNWECWFDNLTIALEGENTLLSGFVSDEAAFHGILNKIRDLNLKLISARII
jgi:hypothetical protein